MERYTVVWNGQIEKQTRDQQIRPAPPLPTAEERNALLKKSLALKKRFECVEMVRVTAMSRLSEITSEHGHHPQRRSTNLSVGG
jgi:hypothetical protein